MDDDDEQAQRPTMLAPVQMDGACVSSESLGMGADVDALHKDAIIGDVIDRATRSCTAVAVDDNDTVEYGELLHSPDNAVFTTLFPKGTGGYVADAPAKCREQHYVRKMLGSIATPFRACEDFLWYHYQKVSSLKRSSAHCSLPHCSCDAWHTGPQTCIRRHLTSCERPHCDQC